MSTHELGPLPKADSYAYIGATDTFVDAFKAETVRAYALAEVARAVEAERAQHQATLALQQRSYEREIELEVEAERSRILERLGQHYGNATALHLEFNAMMREGAR